MCRDLGSEALIGHDFIARRCSRNSDANPVCRSAYDEGRKCGDRSGRRVSARRLPRSTRCHKCHKECHLQLVAVGLSVKAAGIAPASQIPQVVNAHNTCVEQGCQWLHYVCTDAAVRELVASWHGLAPSVKDAITALLRGGWVSGKRRVRGVEGRVALLASRRRARYPPPKRSSGWCNFTRRWT